MKARIILTSILALVLSVSYAQFDIPPGGIPGFPPDNSNCPPGAWCHPNGAGMSFISDSDIDAVNDALENPEGCCCACALGKFFIDVIKPFYPDCYPNCNMEATASSAESTSQSDVSNKKPIATRGKMTKESFNYFKSVLPEILFNKEGKAVALKDLDGIKMKLTGKWVYNEKESNEFYVLSLETVDHKSGASYDRLYVVFNQEHIVILNEAWIASKQKKKRK